VIERAVILSSSEELEIGADVLPIAGALAPAQAPHSLDTAAEAPVAAGGSLAEIERQHIVETLRATGWRMEGYGG